MLPDPGDASGIFFGMMRYLVRYVAALSALLGLSLPSPADTVWLTGRPAFRNVEVRDFRADRLIFRGVSGELLAKPLADVERIALDDVPALTEAERTRAARRADDAVVAYEQALPVLRQRWQSLLARARLADLLDHPTKFDRAVARFLELADAEPETARLHRPRHPGEPGSAVNRHAREAIQEALTHAQAGSITVHLRTLLLELCLHDDVEPLPYAIFGKGAVQEGPASRPAAPAQGPVGLLSDAGETPTATGPAETEAVVTRLGSKSLLLETLPARAGAGHAAWAARVVERAWPYVSEEARPAWRMVRGRVWIAAGRAAEAAADLLELAERDGDRARAARALYYVALAHEQMERPDVAERLYRQLLDRPDLPADVGADVRTGLARVRR
jgi:tetratricopeptide (TPR) repeat protein